MSLSSFLLGEKAAGKQKAIDTELDALFQIQVRLSYFWFDYNSSESIIYRGRWGDAWPEEEEICS
jgi:hypothetical protein